MTKPIKSNFGAALRQVRDARRLTQEAFKSRVYISALERGIKQPTLRTVDELAEVLSVHPLTLLALSYCQGLSAAEITKLCERVGREAEGITSADH